MGRELRRKQNKKEGKPLKELKSKKSDNPYEDVYKMLKTFGIILGIILIIYFFVAVVITKEIDWFKEDSDTTNNTQSVSNAILASETFKQSEEEYYVYYYDFNDEDSSIKTLLNSKLSNSTVYKVDTSDAFNSNYVTTEIGNENLTSLENLKVINPTLIKVVGDSVIEYYQTKDKIIEYLEK